MHQNPPSLVLAAASARPPARGRPNRQRLAQGAWVVLVLLLLVIFVANLLAFFQYASTICTLPEAVNCPTEQLTPAYVQLLDALHLSVALAQDFLAVLCALPFSARDATKGALMRAPQNSH